LSGLLYELGGITLALSGSAAMLMLCWLVTLKLPTERSLSLRLAQPVSAERGSRV
jgi:hypothetical protein